MANPQKLLPGTTAEALLALSARRLLSAALAIGRTAAQVPSLNALTGLANDAMKLSKAEEQDFSATFNSVAGLFGLDLPACDLLMLTLAMELDERIYMAVLNLTGTMFGSPGPRTGSWLAVLYPQATERAAAFSALTNNAPLTRYKLVRLLGADTTPLSQRDLCGEPSLLAHILKGLLPELPEALVGLANLALPLGPDEAYQEDLLSPTLLTLLDQLLKRRAPMQVLHMHPLPSRAALPLARLIATYLKRPLVVLDLKTIEDGEMDVPVAVTLREAHLRHGIPLFINAMATGDDEPNQRRLQRVAQRWRRALALEQDVVLFATEGKDANEMQILEQVGIDLSTFELEPITLQQRRELFKSALDRLSSGPGRIEISKEVDVEQLANTYRVGMGDIDAIVSHAADRARLRTQMAQRTQPRPSKRGGAAERYTVTKDDVGSAARERTRRDLGKFARRVETRYTWSDLVLPDDVTAQLEDFYKAARMRARVFEDWGYGRKHLRGLGLCALFTGESGTGKTMSAEVLARSLNVDLYQVEISAVVSKWIGETERNLGQLFDATEGSGSILFFDEADALFGKRTEVKESKDRYANMEVSFLLQRIENYDNIVILSSNLRSHIDTAFLRRFQFGISFPKPELNGRLALWRLAFPRETPTKNLDLDKLAAKYEDLSGGQIRMIAIGAAMLAASEGVPVQMRHVARSHSNEMLKMQKLV